MSGYKNVLVWVIIQVASVGTVWSGPIKTLVMSGKLIEGHAKFEESCDKCHQPFGNVSRNDLCLKCHENISDDIKNNMGYHGRIEISEKRECIHCHTDHKGRNADIIMLDHDMFKHDKTDYVLRGGHTGVDCHGCHREGVKYRNAPYECMGCHINNDPHTGNLGEKCRECHSETGWNNTDFDHRNTDFPLKGMHKDISCSFCHPGKHFDERVSNSCYTCHVVNDTHNGSFGEKCGICHRETSWRGADFTHQNLKFQLNGRHRNVDCSACHKEGSYENLPKTSCASCHRNDDPHSGEFGNACDKCHSVASDWSGYLFDHDKTSMPLRFRHTKVPCDSCHRLSLKPGSDTTCFYCHKKNDVHSGSYGDKCNLCHSLKNSWSDPVFDHEQINFTLKGSHKKLGCAACHKKKPGTEKPRTKCFDCHSTDDIHENQEGTVCERCHNEEAWNKDLLFDHDLTAFPLIGIHAVTPCEDCHMDSSYKKTPHNCYGCHNSSDTHKKRLSEECGKCHNPNGWRFWTFSHNTDTRFKLDGKHEKIRCVLCHKAFPEDSLRISSVCVDCHLDDDRHKGKFKRACEKCHTTNSFRVLHIRQ